jgi:hypothetical protein
LKSHLRHRLCLFLHVHLLLQSLTLKIDRHFELQNQLMQRHHRPLVLRLLNQAMLRRRRQKSKLVLKFRYLKKLQNIHRR